LPVQSVAVQVRVTLWTPGQAPGVSTSTKVTVAAPQVSLAVGAGNTGLAGHWIGEGATGQVIVGGVVSTTVMVWLQVANRPQASVAFEVRVMLPVPQGPRVPLSVKVTARM